MIKYAMGFVDPRKCSNKHRLLQNACELNPMYAAHEVTAILRRNGVYDSWLSSLHSGGSRIFKRGFLKVGIAE